MGLLHHLNRRIGGVRAGSGANIWEVTTVGLKLLYINDKANGNIIVINKPVRKRHFEPTPRFVEHRLAVAEVYVRLHELARRHDHQVSGKVELAQIDLEPYCWRSYLDIGGRGLYLKPDLYTVTTTNDDGNEYEDHWFFEVDLATESPAVVVRKCEQYVRYYQSSTEQRVGGVFPRVVWLVPTTKRKDSLSRHIADNCLHELQKLFVIITLDELPELVRSGNGKTEVKSS